MQGVTLVQLSELDESTQAQAYADVLQVAIPPDELMTLEEIRAAYVDAVDPEPSAVLLGPAGPVAVMLGEWYAERRVLLLSYVAVRPGQRSTGLGTWLVRDVLRGWYESSPGAVAVAEVDDPRFRPGDDAFGDAVARLRFYDRLGARMLPKPYFQPALRPGAARVPGMLLLRLDDAGSSSQQALRDFLIEYFEACEGEAVRDDPAVLALAADVGGLADPDTSWPLSRYVDLPDATPMPSEPVESRF